MFGAQTVAFCVPAGSPKRRRVSTEVETASRHELPDALLHLAGAVREVDEAAALIFRSRLSV